MSTVSIEYIVDHCNRQFNAVRDLTVGVLIDVHSLLNEVMGRDRIVFIENRVVVTFSPMSSAVRYLLTKGS